MRREDVLAILIETGYLGLAFVLQASVVSYLAVGAARPDLVLGALIYVAIRRGPVHSTVAGFLTGLFQDLSFGGGLGINALCKTVVAFLASHASSRMFKERYWTQVVLLFCAVLVHDLAYFLVLYTLNITELGLAMFRVSLGSALLTAFVSPGYDYLVRRLFSLKDSISRDTAPLSRDQ